MTVERWNEVQQTFDTLHLFGGVCSSNDQDSTFSFIDTQPVNGLNQYRICFIRSSSEMLSVFVPSEKEWFSLFPNPSNGSIQLALENRQNAATLSVYSMSGARLFQQEIRQENSNLEIQFLPAGMYIFEIQTPDRKAQILIQKL